MSLTRSKVKSIIKETFVEKLIDIGFSKRADSLGCYRVRGEFVDVVSIQIGKNYGSLYLHYFTNLLADRFNTNLLNTKIVGERLQGCEEGGESWITDVEDELYPMMENIWEEVGRKSLPFFDGISSVAQYSKLLDEALSKHSVVYPFDLMLTRAIEGREDEAISLVTQIKEEISSDEDYDFDNDEDDISLLKNLNELGEALANGALELLVDKWRTDNLKGLLPAAIKG